MYLNDLHDQNQRNTSPGGVQIVTLPTLAIKSTKFAACGTASQTYYNNHMRLRGVVMKMLT